MSNASNAAMLVGGGLTGIGFTGLGAALTGAGFFGGGDEGGGFDAQAILNAALDRAMGQNTAYTSKAINQLNTGLSASNDAYKQYLKEAINAATSNMTKGLDLSKQLRSPTINTGYNALDAWQQTLGLATPEGGTAALARNTDLANQLAPLLQSLGGQYAYNPEQDRAGILNAVTDQQLRDYILQNSKTVSSFTKAGKKIGQTWTYTGQGANPGTVTTGYSSDRLVNSLLGNADVRAGAAKSSMDAYNTKYNNYNQVNQLLQGVDISKLAPLLRGKL